MHVSSPQKPGFNGATRSNDEDAQKQPTEEKEAFEAAGSSPAKDAVGDVPIPLGRFPHRVRAPRRGGWPNAHEGARPRP
ncbi:hypothetical protein CPLU01_09291 [Colletotrichum plurivorum]|uniref:Uncharacterized protein n=1 Tax=Colletotrichum plurivorum TaxID=2175906 RepID=A0A8H6K9A9_9PEZI|nr:hypothetical protein CPLU01_09291 [Colletotrichum plurivorum]